MILDASAIIAMVLGEPGSETIITKTADAETLAEAAIFTGEDFTKTDIDPA